MHPNKLYVAFDVFGNPFGVSPRLEDFSYHPAERTGEYVKAEVADLLANAKVDLMVRVVELEDCIRELLKGGDHDGECDNEQGLINEGGACQKHCDAAKQREDAAKELLGHADRTQ